MAHIGRKKILVVGAGLSGASIARELADHGWFVDVIDQRDHIAGNAYDYVDHNIFRIHKYGPHLFHTNNNEVVDWLSRFTEWMPYRHQVKALLSDGTFVTLPPNRETRNILGDQGVVDVLFRPYTKKMWAMDLEDLDPEIIKRIPFRDDDNEDYFPNDSFQALPKQGYTEMTRRMLDHKNIMVSILSPFDTSLEADYAHIFNAMPIDAYFDFCLGPLPYRSIKFTNRTFPTSTLFKTATTNFTHDGPFTRVTEWRHLPGHGSHPSLTALTFEEPCDPKDNNDERYYPVKDVDGINRARYKEYRRMCPANITFIGRCGQYVYIDMDQAISSSLATARRFLAV
jgi:UDP-galactopyranose mutase